MDQCIGKKIIIYCIIMKKVLRGDLADGIGKKQNLFWKRLSEMTAPFMCACRRMFLTGASPKSCFLQTEYYGISNVPIQS